MVSMSAEAFGMVMECKEWMEDELGRVKTVVEDLSKKMRLNSLSIVNDERMERSLKRVRRELRKLRCRTCERNAGKQESEEQCQNYLTEKVKRDTIEASINTIKLPPNASAGHEPRLTVYPVLMMIKLCHSGQAR